MEISPITININATGAMPEILAELPRLARLAREQAERVERMVRDRHLEMNRDRSSQWREVADAREYQESLVWNIRPGTGVDLEDDEDLQRYLWRDRRRAAAERRLTTAPRETSAAANAGWLVAITMVVTILAAALLWTA